MQSERDFLLDIENDLQCAISLVGHQCDLEIIMFTIRKARVKVNKRLVDLWAGSTEQAQVPTLQTEIQA